MKIRFLSTVWAVSLFGIVSWNEFKLGMDTRLNGRYWQFAFPAAISHLSHGMPWNFTSYAGIKQFIEGNLSQPDVLECATSLSNFDQTLSCFLFDDKGYVELTRLAFILFGIDASSILKFYIFVFGCSVLLYLFAHRKSTWSLVLLNLILLGIYVAIFAFPICTELGEVTNPRAIGMLSVVGVCHLLVTIVRGSSTHLASWIMAILQATIIALVCFTRSPELWQFLFPFIGAVIAMIFFPHKRSAALSVLCSVVICFIGLCIYQHLALKHPYFDKNGTKYSRLRWHNVGIGYALHPYLAEKYQLTLDDAPMIKLIFKKAKILGIQDKVFSSEHFTSVYNWVKYDQIAKKVVFEILKENFISVVNLYLFYKPIAFVKTLMSATKRQFTNKSLNAFAVPFSISPKKRIELDAHYAFFRFIAIMSLSLLIPAIYFITTRELAAVAGIIGSVWVGSLLPGFITYPMYYIIGFGFATTASLIYLALAFFVIFVIRSFFRFKVFYQKIKYS